MAIAGERVFTIAGAEVLCLDAETGRKVWNAPFDFSNCTPTIAEGKAYVYSEEGLFCCLNTKDGKEVWRVDMRVDFNADKKGMYGYAVSPLVVDDLVVVAGRIDGGALLAFDRHTGKPKWSASHKGHRSYGLWSSPVLARIEGESTIVWLAGPSLAGIDPVSGETRWRYDIPPEKGKSGCAASTPVVWENQIVAQFHPPHARGHTFCVEITKGEAQLKWLTRDLVPWYFSCAALDGHIYGTDQGPGKPSGDIGRVQCYEIATGRLKWSTDGPAAKNPFIIVDGKMISWGRSLAVTEVGPTGQTLVADQKLRAEGTQQIGKWAPPAFANGRLYLRSMRNVLLCLDLREADQSDAAGKTPPPSP